MEILETVYTYIVSAICCTRKEKKAKDVEIKIDETHSDKTEGIFIFHTLQFLSYFISI